MAMTQAQLDAMRRAGVPEQAVQAAQGITVAKPVKLPLAVPNLATPVKLPGTPGTGTKVPLNVKPLVPVIAKAPVKAAAPVVTPAPATGTGGNPYDIFYKPPIYVSQYKADADALIAEARGMKYDPASYNPENDASFTTFRNNATATGQRDYSATLGTRNQNGLVSSSVSDSLAQRSMDLQTKRVEDAVPEFQAKDEAAFTAKRNEKLTMAENLLGLDKNAYDRFVQDEGITNDAKTRYENDTGLLAMDLTAIPKDSWVWAIPDYSTEIKNRTAANPNDIMLPVLKAIRAQKIRANPALNAKYGNTIVESPGVKSYQTQTEEAAAAADAEQLVYDRGQDTIKNDLDTRNTNSIINSRGKSGPSASSKTVSSKGTPQQVEQYYSVLKSYLTGNTMKTGGADAVSNAALAEKGSLVVLMGEGLTDLLLGELKGNASTVAQPKATPPPEIDTKAALGTIYTEMMAEPDPSAWLKREAGNMNSDELTAAIGWLPKTDANAALIDTLMATLAALGK